MPQEQKNFFRLNIAIFVIFILLYFSLVFSSSGIQIFMIFSGVVLFYGIGSGVFFFFKIKEKQDLSSKSEKSALRDPLTGFPTRAGFEEILNEQLEVAKKEKTNLTLGYFDLDGFKRWNESLSPNGREDLLEKTGDFLRENFENDVTISRFWGDRFAFIIPRGLSQAEKEVSFLREKIAQTPFFIGGREINLQASCGLALYPGNGGSREKLQKEASKYLQQAKKLGGNFTISRKNAFSLDFPESISVFNRDSFLDSISKTSTQLYLLYKDKEIEIVRQHIVEGKPFSVDNPGDQSGFEFFYILEGKIKSIDQEKVFNAGSYITTGTTKDRKFFETITPVEILYITSNSIFAEQSKHLAHWKVMVDRVKEKDKRIASHSSRIETMANKMGQAMGLEGEKLFSLIYAAFLHDVGKTKVPGEILQKNGPLNEDEWKIVKKHPEWGKELILENLKLNYTDKRVGEIVYQHHENYNGNGYPQGLKGEEILLEAQILSLLDAFDAMTSERPYQSAKTIPQALEEIKRCRGTQFAPRVVDEFIKLMEEDEE